MTSVFLPMLLGALIGWLGSLFMRTDTQSGIIMDVLLGAVGAVAGLRLLGSGTGFDNVLAAYLGAVTFVGLLAFVRRETRRRAAAAPQASGGEDAR